MKTIHTVQEKKRKFREKERQKIIEEWEKKSRVEKEKLKNKNNEKKNKQAGAELCQAQHNLGQLPVAWNFALAGAAYSASCGYIWKHG